MTARRWVVLLALVGATIAVSATTLGAIAAREGTTDASGDFEISIANSIDVPRRTVNVSGESFAVTSVARKHRGGTLAVDVTAPGSDTTYDVNLYNSKTRIEASESMTGSGTARFDTGSMSAGLYYAAVYHDGNTVELYPVVLAAYDVTFELPSNVEPGSTVSATITVTRRGRERPPNFVQVVIGDDRRQLRVNATQSSDGTYTTDVTVDLPAGRYAAYGVARGENETDNGEPEVVGISGGQTVRVSESTPTPDGSADDGDGGGDGGGGGGGSTADGTTSQTRVGRTQAPKPDTQTAGPSQSQPTGSNPSPAGSPERGTDGTEGTATATSNDMVITPGPTDTVRRTTPEPTPGFGPGSTVLALVGLVTLAFGRIRMS